VPVVHRTAIVASSARLGNDVEVGPYAVVGEDVELGDGTVLLSHAIVHGPATLGQENVLHPFAVVGGAPQQKKLEKGARATLTMGHGNVVREHVTIHRGGGATGTRVGDDNLFMVASHVAHDVTVGSHVTLANGAQIAGHVEIRDHASFGGQSGVAQFVEIGESAFVAAGAMCERDVPPFVIVQGDRARVRALNVVGLRRRAVPEASIGALRRAFRLLFVSGTPRAEALQRAETSDPYVAELVRSLSSKSAP
jgi:UDP-N-acetylglucosamine acyltransferase